MQTPTVDRAEARLKAPVLCAGAHCVQTPRKLMPGLRLCEKCRHGLTGDLARLTILYHMCGQLLAGSPPRPIQDKIPGGRIRSAVFNMAAADARTAILGVLASWSGMVADGRRIGPPQRTVGALADFLVRHADWLAAQEVAPEMTNEFRALVRQARSIVEPHRQRRITVGACVESGCRGHLVVVVRPREAALSPKIICDHDRAHCWAAESWMRLSAEIGRPPDAAPRWLSATAISRLWRTPVGSVYRLASEGEWRRRREAGRTYYHEADVEQTFRLRRR
jgi:hypothetical protein